MNSLTVWLDKTGRVFNVIAGDNVTPPDGFSIGPSGGKIGDTWDGEKYISDPEPQPIINSVPLSNNATIQDRLAALELITNVGLGEAE